MKKRFDIRHSMTAKYILICSSNLDVWQFLIVFFGLKKAERAGAQAVTTAQKAWKRR